MACGWRWAVVGAILLSILIAVGWWFWPFLQLPGEIAVRVQGPECRCLYTLRPGHWLDQRWEQITPSDVYVFESAWSPDGKQVAFRCSDGIVYNNQRRLLQPGQLARDYDPERDVVSNGLCVVDRQGDGFRWLIDEAGNKAPSHAQFPWPSDGLSAGDLRWTREGRYIVFRSNIRFDQWLAIDPVTGQFGGWEGEVPESEAERWSSGRSNLQNLEQIVARTRGSCFRHWRRYDLNPFTLHGSPSPNGRYLAWIKAEAVGTPSDIVVYDTVAERLLCVSHTTDYLYDLVWLPKEP